KRGCPAAQSHRNRVSRTRFRPCRAHRQPCENLSPARARFSASARGGLGIRRVLCIWEQSDKESTMLLTRRWQVDAVRSRRVEGVDPVLDDRMKATQKLHDLS